MGDCALLSRLPTELRLHIWEHVLAFERPIKLRQVVAGSVNLSILRTNRQIYNEALPVFYDVNTIIATRNDFCKITDPELQTPLKRDQLRHLLIRSFSQSIKCSSFSGGNHLYLPGCCENCRPSGVDFLQALASLPRMQSVVIDYQNHHREFDFIRKTMHDILPGAKLKCTGLTRFRYISPSLSPDQDFTFVDMPVSTIWSELLANKAPYRSVFALPGENELLSQLRNEFGQALPDRLHLFLCKCYSKFYATLYQVLHEAERAKAEGQETSEPMERLTDLVVAQIGPSNTATPAQSREELSRLRYHELMVDL